MDVAIIGAGLAGLSCAHELEKYGITPVIYERNGFIGETYPHCTAVLRVMQKSVTDAVSYCRDVLDLDYKPINPIKRIIQSSPHVTMAIRGSLGYLIDATKGESSIKRQLFSLLKKTRIFLNTPGDYCTLSKEYRHVVVATGDTRYTEELGCWYEWVRGYARGAIVLGDFDPHTVLFWVNKEYCKSGYAYLTPFSARKACLVLIVADTDENEANEYWNLFLSIENIRYEIVQEFIYIHKNGHVYPHKTENILFAGNAGGGVDSLFGFGYMNAMKMGVMAARTIAMDLDYDEMIKSAIERNLWIYWFRKAFSRLDNKGYDRLMRVIGLPGVKQLVYTSPLDVIKHGGKFLRRYDRKLDMEETKKSPILR